MYDLNSARFAAVHEAGHIVLACLVSKVDPNVYFTEATIEHAIVETWEERNIGTFEGNTSLTIGDSILRRDLACLAVGGMVATTMVYPDIGDLCMYGCSQDIALFEKIVPEKWERIALKENVRMMFQEPDLNLALRCIALQLEKHRRMTQEQAVCIMERVGVANRKMRKVQEAISLGPGSEEPKTSLQKKYKGLMP